MGRFRIVDNGATQLEALRERLHGVIQRERGAFDPELSAHWRGVPRRSRPLARRLSHWLVLGVLATVLLGLYITFSLLLASASDPVIATLGSLRVERANVQRAAAATPAPAAAAPPTAATLRLRPLLQAEIAQGLLDVEEDAHAARVLLQGDSLYEPGRADVRPGVQPVLARIADALNRLPGVVTVTGHTDNQPMRSLRFPSNYELSLQRAQGVAAVLQAGLQDSTRLHVEGRADTQPLAGNDTLQGRARNRRVEIALRYAP
jgi:type VI secretion system protein ImpK